MKTYLNLVVLLSLCSLSLGQDCSPQLLEDVDFPGHDIKLVYSPDTDHCQQLCTQHPSCLFFTFIRADWTKDNRHFYCYLKTTSSGQPNVKIQLQGATSGFSLKACAPEPQPCLPKVYNNVDFPGANYRSLFTADHEECQRACTQDPGCQFFTYLNEFFTAEKLRYKCHLKFSWSIPVSPIVEKKTGVVSGLSYKILVTQQSEPACESKLFPNTGTLGKEVMVISAVSPGHCQALCSDHPSCTFFSFVSREFSCNLKNNTNEMVTVAKEGTTSGLPSRFCQPDDNWVKVAHEGVDFYGSDIRSERVKDADACQRKCNEDLSCQFYSYTNENFFDRFFSGRCYHKRAITMPAPPKVTKLDNVVSGFQLRNCV
ncbi:LOW QUALITY PROTEIN: coagulation factor XI-like [Cottoperca gobio]|uniref:LOW QUALITY PROTEIN: coagulation factor XI-like n=1 Tax=Cottoperca gobio TaxID=56716 RepID=A0A6J2QNQ2_COTGO|nr:LOW QUALITY PROTEIN: coagulation factor XI-like [Cottoperca gobio]